MEISKGPNGGGPAECVVALRKEVVVEEEEVVPAAWDFRQPKKRAAVFSRLQGTLTRDGKAWMARGAKAGTRLVPSEEERCPVAGEKGKRKGPSLQFSGTSWGRQTNVAEAIAMRSPESYRRGQWSERGLHLVCVRIGIPGPSWGRGVALVCGVHGRGTSFLETVGETEAERVREEVVAYPERVGESKT